jgi:hypothetical protein
MSAFLSEEETPENAIFGYLVADLSMRIGHLGFHADSTFCDMSPEAQKEIIKDWVMLLNDCIEVLEKKQEGRIQ